jgi:hypothetical protein
MTQGRPAGPPEGWQPPPQQPGWGSPRGQQPPWQGPQPGWGPQPPWGPPPQPRQQLTAGRAFLIMLGAAFGAVLGFVVPFLPGFLAQALLGVDIYPPGIGPWLGLAMLVTVPCGAILGALWVRGRTRKGR